jgi:hypothetical protein
VSLPPVPDYQGANWLDRLHLVWGWVSGFWLSDLPDALRSWEEQLAAMGRLG